MKTGALQHLLVRARRWWVVRDLRARRTQVSMLVDSIGHDVAQDMAALIELRAELQHINRQLALIERGEAAARARLETPMGA